MISRHASLPVALKLALRELRGGLAGFRIFMACLILGVTAIAAIGSLTRAIEDGLEKEGQTILGGDLEVSLFQTEADEDFTAWATERGTLSTSARFRTMAQMGAEGSTLVELRAVDSQYPLYGKFETSPARDKGSLFEKRGDLWGTVIAPEMASRYNLSLGDTLRFGAVTAEIRAFIENEPDKANLGFQLGPSAFLAYDALSETGLVTTGSLINHIYRLHLNESGTDMKLLREDLKEAFPDANWRVRDHKNAAPGLQRFVDQMGMFLTLVGIAALVVGGVGVGNAVRGYMDRKTKTIATFKILGAPGNTVFAVYFIQIMAIAFLAITIGLLVGAFLPGFLADFLPDTLPVQAEAGVYPSALVVAALYGLLITAAFTLWPLGKARDLPAVHLFRAIVSPSTQRPRGIYIVAITLAVLLVALLAIGLAGNKGLAAGFLGGAFAVLLLLRGTSWLIERGAAKLPRAKKPLLRMAIANIHRPGAATGAVVISLGLGLTLFASLALIQGNMNKQLADQVPSEAPAFFLLDIQPYDVERFRETALSVEGVSDVVTIPNLRGRVTHIKGIPASEAKIQEGGRWVLRGDRGLTYSKTLYETNTLVDGEWWPEDYAGDPEVSLGAEEAGELGLSVGDTLTVNVMGRDITATVRSLREIDWGGFGFNFIIMFDPYTLKAAPHTYMATLKAAGDAEREAHETLTTAFPGITAIRMKEVLTSMNTLINQIGTAVEATALVAIIAGILVLAGAIAAGFRQRVYESVIMKIVGAVRAQILRAYLLEYALIGFVTAIIALGLGSLTGYLVIEQAMKMEFTFLPGPILITLAVSLTVTILFGLMSSLRALSAKASTVLRSE